MEKKRILGSFLIICFHLLSSAILFAQLPKRVDGEKIKTIITKISADEYMGRETGTPGCTMAEDFFAAEFQKLGLQPAGDNDSYYYNYILKDRKETEKPTLIIDNRTFVNGRGEDFQLNRRSDGGQAEAEIVFAGYGISCAGKNRNDFDSIDIRGKIVLIRRGAPNEDIGAWRPFCIDSVKAEYCYNNGALGILIYEPLERASSDFLVPDFNNSLSAFSTLKDFPVLNIDERVAKFIFQKTKFTYWRTAQNMNRQNVSFNTGKKCKISAAVSKENIKARNVLAMLPGSDPVLKNEYVIIGGHIDHVGVSPDGEIRNGADDNASGPSVALGIAQAMVKNKFRPKRSIIFAGWTGEEKGLLGSKAWCENPGVDLKKVVVYFNLDMVGLGDGKLNMPGTEFAPEVYEFLINNSDSTLFKDINWRKGGLGGSDHNYFLLHGVPAFAGITSGPHPDYHQPADDADKIKADILQLTGDFIYYSAEKIANSKEVFISENRFNENKIRLIESNLLLPVASLNYKEGLAKSFAGLAILDFSDLTISSDPQENFISLLKGFNNIMEFEDEKERFILAATANQAVYSRWNDYLGLLAGFNPDHIGSDETWFRVLSKYGYRMAFLDGKSKINLDTSYLKELITISGKNSVGLLLNNLSQVSLESVLSRSNKPALILCSDPGLLNEKIIKLIIDGNHLVVFQINKENGIQNDIAGFEVLRNKIGSELITIAPMDHNDSSKKYFLQFLLKFIADYPDEDFQSMVLTGNFEQFAAAALQ
jgi:hypothetical protein